MWCSYAPAPMKLSGWISCAARSRIRRDTCISFSPSPTAVSLPLFSAAGISSNSASIFFAPMLASMDLMSCSVWGMKGIVFRIQESDWDSDRREGFRILDPESRILFLMCFAIHNGLICRCIHQCGHIRRVVGLHFEHPCGVRSIVDFFRGAVQFAVHRRHFTGNRRVHVRCGLHRFHYRAFFLGLELAADCRGFDKYHVAQKFLRVLGDADADGAVGFAPDPFVGGGVFQVCWVAHFWSPDR